MQFTLTNNTLTSHFDSCFTFSSVNRLHYKSVLTRHSERLRLIKWLKEAITLLILVTEMTSPYRQTAMIHHSDVHLHNAMTTGIFFRVFLFHCLWDNGVSQVKCQHDDCQIFSEDGIFFLKFRLACIQVQIIKPSQRSMQWIHVEACQGVWGPVQYLRLHFLTALLCEQTDSWSAL